ncbi:elongation factor G, partial [Planctomycetota bacterium]
MEKISKIRNIGISAHIDSGKTTLSERMLYYAGRIHRMQEVHGDKNEKGGATMDYMELERERGITITSAATQVDWQGKSINLIDTPGHVDFTVEVERSLRVLDGAIMILCSVGGVQSQSMTVDQQIKRYRVPRIAFINKMDRVGADPERVRRDIVEKLGLNVVPIQLPMGAGDDFAGVIDLITMEALSFSSDDGESVERTPIPAHYLEPAELARHEMLEALSMFNDEMMEKLMEEQTVDEALIHQTLREATINRDIVPLMLGSAFKNKGVQPLMDAVCDYLPSPLDRSYFARDHNNEGAETPLNADPDAPLVAMIFKIADESFGQLSYVRVYQGTMRKSDQYRNARTNKTVRVGRIVKMHANDREDIADAGPGDIVALLSVDCASGDTICGAGINYSLESIFVADPVISLSITPAGNADKERMGKALSRFMKEDPTFRVSTDPETSETVIAGMGELHLD